MEFRAQRKLLQALHVTQQEHTVKFAEHTTQLRELREEMRSGFERVHVGVDAILGLLGGTPETSD